MKPPSPVTAASCSLNSSVEDSLLLMLSLFRLRGAFALEAYLALSLLERWFLTHLRHQCVMPNSAGIQAV